MQEHIYFCQTAKVNAAHGAGQAVVREQREGISLSILHRHQRIQPPRTFSSLTKYLQHSNHCLRVVFFQAFQKYDQCYQPYVHVMSYFNKL
jgi:hypothetical protein